MTDDRMLASEIFALEHLRWIRYLPEDRAHLLYEWLDTDSGQQSAHIEVVFGSALVRDDWMDHARINKQYVSEATPLELPAAECFSELHSILNKWRYTRDAMWRWTRDSGWQYLCRYCMTRTWSHGTSVWCVPTGEDTTLTEESVCGWIKPGEEL